jgi:transcriptional regulator with XRE-family HTH domain
MSIGDKIVALRRAAALSQEELAEAVGVSRQAAAKWETGESVPEIDRLVRIATLFAVSVDSLVRDADPCAPAAAPAPAVDGATIAFLIRAKRACYAGHGAETTPSRPSSHDLSYREGELSYYDTYLGGERFAGEEAIWRAGVPFWAMNYVGRTLDGRFSGDFLKDALAAAPSDMPFRGPRSFSKGEYSYHCMPRGDLAWFEGREEIYAGDDKVYECLFHGGLVR